MNLITGCYGFLGFSTAKALLEQGEKVIGVDRLVHTNSPKAARVKLLRKYDGFKFYEADLTNYEQLDMLFRHVKVKAVMHFAAQYAVQHKPDHVRRYGANNCVAFLNIIELTRLAGIERFHYASSTFVEDGVLPSSLYGATKQFNELAAHVYSKAQGMTTVGIRYGSTFGPWCRPDVGIYQIAKKMLRGEQIKVTDAFHYQTAFLDGDDAVAVTVALMNADKLKGFNVFTAVAEDHRKDLGELTALLEKHMGIKAKVDWTPYTNKQPGGIPQAQCDALKAAIGFCPSTSIDHAVHKFANWIQRREREGKEI